jgi:peptidyl-prolyl cis-trans isomerase B (cyclophilin B)
VEPFLELLAAGTGSSCERWPWKPLIWLRLLLWFWGTSGARNNQTGESVNKTNTNEVAIILTTQGEMVIEFWPEVAPGTVENFKKLARDGFYNGTAFHRIVKGFMIQGGDPLSKSDDSKVGTGGPGYKIKAEFNGKPHVRGVISMARSQDPDSAGSQFFICLADARFLDRQYTAFGQSIKGDEVLGRIGDIPTAVGSGGERSKPTSRVGVESISIVPAERPR